jgi:hypothetical protein
MKKKHSKETPSAEKKPKPFLNWLSPQHPFYGATLLPGLYEQIKQEVLTTDAVWKGYKGGPAEKRIEELLPAVEKAKKASSKKTAKDVWRYLESNLPRSAIEVDGIEGPYFYKGQEERLVWLYPNTSTRSIGYTTFRLRYFSKKAKSKKDK